MSLWPLLFACSSFWHLKQAKKHAYKAEQKGATVKRDTVRTTVSDTTVFIDTFNNVITKTVTIRDTVRDCENITYSTKSRTEIRQQGRAARAKARQDGKTKRKTSKHENKTQQIEAKQKGKTERKKFRRGLWWLYMLFGILVGYFVETTYEKLKARAKGYLLK